MLKLLGRLFRKGNKRRPPAQGGIGGNQSQQDCVECGATGPWVRRSARGAPLCESCFRRQAEDAIADFAIRSGLKGKTPAKDRGDATESESVLGWAACKAVQRGGGSEDEIWEPEPAFTYILVLVQRNRSAKRFIHFSSSEVSLQIEGAGARKPIGVVPCLSRDFRSAAGQRVPILLATNSATFEQEAADCYGILFCPRKEQRPLSIKFKGSTIPLEPLPVTDTTAPSMGPPTRLTMRSECQLESQIPFSFEKAAVSGFSIFVAPTEHSGILAIGSRIGQSIVVARVSRQHSREIRPQEIHAHLRDGSALPAKGLLMSVSGRPALVDKALLTERKSLLEPGGTATYREDYCGPLTDFDEFGCKVVAAFDAQADWQSVLALQVGTYRTEFEDGTVVY